MLHCVGKKLFVFCAPQLTSDLFALSMVMGYSIKIMLLTEARYKIQVKRECNDLRFILIIFFSKQFVLNRLLIQLYVSQ